MVNLATKAFTHGGTGQLKPTLENPTDIEVELLTVTYNGQPM